MSTKTSRMFVTTLEAMPNGKVRVSVPFDPNEVWGPKREHRIGGTVGAVGVRGSVVGDAFGWSFSLGPAWLRDCSVGPGQSVEVVIEPEGPQRDELAPDLAAALEANLGGSARRSRSWQWEGRSPIPFAPGRRATASRRWSTPDRCSRRAETVPACRSCRLPTQREQRKRQQEVIDE